MTITYDRAQILATLPQQPPFLFLDRAVVGDDRVTAHYAIRGDEFFLAGHFKNEPIFPASILFEALGQAACLWVLERAPQQCGAPIPTNQVFFASLDGAHVYRKTRPGEQLVLEVILTKLRDPLAIFRGSVTTATGERVAQIERLMLAFGDQVLPAETAVAT